MVLVRTAVEDYAFAIKRLSKATQREYASKLNTFVGWCESQTPPIQLEDIKQSVIRRFVEHLRVQTNPRTGKPPTAITIHGYCRTLKVFLAWCSREEGFEDIVSSRTASRIEMPRVEQKVIETFTDAQIHTLFNACSCEYNQELRVRDKAIISVLVDTGIRAGELVGLTVENCFLYPHDAYLKVFGKGYKWREVPLGDFAVAALRRYITRYRRGSSATSIVLLNRSNEPLTVYGLDQIIAKLGREAHITGVRCSPHTFRHTYAVRYLANGGDVYKLSRLMGHVSVTTTEVYLRGLLQLTFGLNLYGHKLRRM